MRITGRRRTYFSSFPRTGFRSTRGCVSVAIDPMNSDTGKLYRSSSRRHEDGLESYSSSAANKNGGNILRIPRSANSCDVLHPVSLPGLALVWRIRLLPVARCRSDVRPDEARPNSLSLDRIIPIESAHAIVEASNHGRIQWCRMVSCCRATRLTTAGSSGRRTAARHRDREHRER